MVGCYGGVGCGGGFDLSAGDHFGGEGVGVCGGLCFDCECVYQRVFLALFSGSSVAGEGVVGGYAASGVV